MNTRVKEIRKALGLSGEKFGEKIGLKKVAISQIETGKNSPTEQTILSICREFNVSETWLRTGEGDMFVQSKESFLADIQKQYALSDFDIQLVQSYIALDEADRASIQRFITSCVQKTDQDEV